VIATLWEIDDEIAVTVAENFYTRLRPGPGKPLDPNLAAIALHHATRELRARHPNLPSWWAAYLHAGA
jgi:CHAT domain-containing protein